MLEHQKYSRGSHHLGPFEQKEAPAKKLSKQVVLQKEVHLNAFVGSLLDSKVKKTELNSSILLATLSWLFQNG